MLPNTRSRRPNLIRGDDNIHRGPGHRRAIDAALNLPRPITIEAVEEEFIEVNLNLGEPGEPLEDHKGIQGPNQSNTVTMNRPPPINPLVQPRGLPIVVPEGLQAAPMPSNLPSFRGTRDEDPSMHVERFLELLTSCLITDPRYFLVWFPTTLRDSAYEWYRNHAARSFLDWDALMRAFLEHYRLARH